jgi:hypothetical protein
MAGNAVSHQRIRLGTGASQRALDVSAVAARTASDIRIAGDSTAGRSSSTDGRR